MLTFACLNHSASPGIACAADPDVLSKYAGLAAVCDPASAAELGAQLPRAGGLSAAELDALENTNIGGWGGATGSLRFILPSAAAGWAAGMCLHLSARLLTSHVCACASPSLSPPLQPSPRAGAAPLRSRQCPCQPARRPQVQRQWRRQRGSARSGSASGSRATPRGESGLRRGCLH